MADLPQPPTRTLLVIADDFGIGPETTRGILDSAERSVLSGTVLLVNSPYAADAVDLWRRRGRPLELGWHPNLTLDSPILPLSSVPSLVAPNGCFWKLGAFLGQRLRGRIVACEIEDELRAQYRRFLELVGQPPAFVNTHQHIGLFQPVGPLLLDILADQRPRPVVRRVREPWSLLLRVPGARKKRILLNTLGRRAADLQETRGFPGNDWMIGITDPPWVRDSEFFPRWLRAVPGRLVELMCHPGHEDQTLLGRDAETTDGLIQRRVDEYERLAQPNFLAAVRDAGFVLRRPSELLSGRRRVA
jgi:predicted glycoside hydrolase/deacetylase ChbG (UPF0249 family)